MKLRYTLLFVLAVTLSTGLAKANAVDPSVILNDPPPPLGLSSGCPKNTVCLSVPVVVLPLNNGVFPQISFTYTGPNTDAFYVVLDDVLPGETFTCSSNFLSCSLVSANTCSSILCNIINTIVHSDPDHDAIAFAFTGTLDTNTGLQTAVSAPEPGLMCQLLIGILPLLFFGRKYWVVDRSA
ncbi:MAG TPA: hypothetical protein VND42_01860 [Candidatus Acidoferrales bacterium]|nr:hypothetical protein [Candidatus Acidoferrales bacterium]